MIFEKVRHIISGFVKMKAEVSENSRDGEIALTVPFGKYQSAVGVQSCLHWFPVCDITYTLYPQVWWSNDKPVNKHINWHKDFNSSS